MKYVPKHLSRQPISGLLIYINNRETFWQFGSVMRFNENDCVVYRIDRETIHPQTIGRSGLYKLKRHEAYSRELQMYSFEWVSE